MRSRGSNLITKDLVNSSNFAVSRKVEQVLQWIREALGQVAPPAEATHDPSRELSGDQECRNLQI